MSRGMRSQVAVKILLFVSAIGFFSLPPSAHANGEGSTQFTGLNAGPAANLVTGSSSYSIPIMIPPGHEGATPSLSLDYMSGAGDSEYGRGWGLTVGEIVRGGRHGVPRCVGDLTNNDFVLSMPGVAAELVYGSDGKFYAKYDEGFLVAEANVSNNSWTVYDRAGNVYEFGSSGSARSWKGSDVFLNTATCSFTARWSLVRITTPRGATVDIAYTRVENTPLIDSIQYGGFPTLSTGSIPHAFTVAFSRKARTFKKDVYRLGVKETFANLVERISVSYRPTAGSNFVPIREYLLDHLETPFGGDANLVSVQTAGLPTKTFEYASNDVQVKNVQGVWVGSGTNQAVQNGSYTYRANYAGYTNSVITDSRIGLMDMTGDGIPDRIDVLGPTDGPQGWTVLQGSGTSFSSVPLIWDTSEVANATGGEESISRQFSSGGLGDESPDRLFFGEFATADLTGDGFPDFIDARPIGNASPDAPTNWRVHPGKCDANGCRFLPPLANWSAPRSYLSRTKRQKKDSHHRYFDIDYMMLVDLNGDGYTDFLETPEPPSGSTWIGDGGPAAEPSGNWVVYFGSANGFGAAQSLDMSGYLGIRYGVVQPETPSLILRSFFDFNADGLPDRVSANVWFLSGAMGYAHVSNFQSCPGPSSTCEPASFVDVELSTGTGFAPAVRSLLTGGDVEFSGFLGWDDSIKTAETVNVTTTTENRTRQSFFDVNGDGLPDWVMGGAGGSGERILYNVGGGKLEAGPDAFERFGPGLTMTIPKRKPAGLYYPLRLSTTTAFISAGGVDFVPSSTFTNKDVVDINGDGLLEVVHPAVSTPQNDWLWNIARFESTNEYKYRFGLLAKVNEGNGVVSEMKYAPSTLWDHTGGDGVADLPFARWVVVATRRTDGLCTPQSNVDRFTTQNQCVSSGHEQLRTFQYSGGLFDPVERMFMGFKTAREIDTDGNVVETTHSLTPATTGKPLRRDVYAGSILLRRTDWTWGNGPPTPGVPSRRQIYLSRTSTIDYARSPGYPIGSDLCGLTINDQVDVYGRVARTCSVECSVDGAGAVSGSYSCSSPVNGMETVITEWAEPVSGYLRERPKQVELSGYRNGSSELISRVRYEYDGVLGNPLPLGQVERGLVQRVSSYLDESATNFAPGWIVTEQRDYDQYGNPKKVWDAHGRRTQHTYDPNLFALYKSTSAYTSATNLDFNTSYQTDLRFGTLTSTTDANSDTVQAAYDNLGRTVCEAQPGDTITGCLTSGPFNATVTREFQWADPLSSNFESRHNRIIERHVEPNAPGGYLETINYIDGLGRGRFRKVQRVVGTGSNTSISYVIEGQSDYDSEGRIVKQYVPYLSIQGSPNPTVSAVVTSYGPLNGISGGVVDPIGRPRTIDPPGPALTTFAYEGRRKRTINVIGGEQQEYYDARQRVVATVSLDNGVVVTSSAVQLDAAGRVAARMVSGIQSTFSWQEYDSMGRRVRANDADSGGTWEYGYDYLGNVIFTNDPKAGQHVQTVYDDMSRPVRICTYGADAFVANATSGSCGTGGTTETTFGYDTGGGATANQMGRLVNVSDFAGASSQYSSKTLSYDDAGRVTNELYSIDGRVEWFNYGHDRAGHLLYIGFSLGESATYGYNAVGQPVSLKALNSNGSVQSDHVTDVDYDIFGRITKLQYANGVVDTRTYSQQENDAFSLIGLQTQKAGATYLNLAYQQNSIGKIQSITDLRDTSGPLKRTATYTYDGVGRLTQVANSTSNGQFGFDAIGNLTAKNGQTLSYDPNVGSAGPHHLDAFGSLAVTYDANGNRATKARSNGGLETYSYDRLNRLARIEIAGPGAETVTFKYGASGKKAIKQVGATPATRYYGDFLERSFLPRVGGGYDEIQTKHFFIAGIRVSSSTQNFGFSTGQAFPATPLYIPKDIVFGLSVATLLLIIIGSRQDGLRIPQVLGRRLSRAGGATLLVLWLQVPAVLLLPTDAIAGGGGAPPVSTVHYYHGDHLGSTHAVTDQSGNLTVQIRYDTYGKEILRVDGSGNAITAVDKVKHGFTGHEREHTSGLIDAGARFLDADLAQFLTVDPAGQFLSPYAYGPGDPVNGTDPSGAAFGIDDLFVFVAILAASYSFSAGAAAAMMGAISGNWKMALLGAVQMGLGYLGVVGAAATPAVGLLSGEGIVNGTQAGLTTYSLVQEARGRSVGWGAMVAQLALGVVQLAYSVGRSTAASGLHSPSGGAESEPDLPLSVPEQMYARYLFEEAVASGAFPTNAPGSPRQLTELGGPTLTELQALFEVEFAVHATSVGNGQFSYTGELAIGPVGGGKVIPPAAWTGPNSGVVHSHPIGDPLFSGADLNLALNRQWGFIGVVSRSPLGLTFTARVCASGCLMTTSLTDFARFEPILGYDRGTQWRVRY